jgi:mRNA interferase MazF
MKHGDIRWYRFTHPDKQRPVLILTRNSIIGYLNEVTVAPVTSTIREIPSEVYLNHTDGMAQECAVNCDHIQTVAKSRIGSLITSLTDARMTEVRQAITFALDL